MDRMPIGNKVERRFGNRGDATEEPATREATGVLKVEELESRWYVLRDGKEAKARREVVLRLPNGEVERFIDPVEYPPEIVLLEITYWSS